MNQKGGIIIYVLGIVAFMAVSTSVLVIVTTNELKQSFNIDNAMQASYKAESQTENFLYETKKYVEDMVNNPLPESGDCLGDLTCTIDQGIAELTTTLKKQQVLEINVFKPGDESAGLDGGAEITTINYEVPVGHEVEFMANCWPVIAGDIDIKNSTIYKNLLSNSGSIAATNFAFFSAVGQNHLCKLYFKSLDDSAEIPGFKIEFENNGTPVNIPGFLKITVSAKEQRSNQAVEAIYPLAVPNEDTALDMFHYVLFSEGDIN